MLFKKDILNLWRFWSKYEKGTRNYFNGESGIEQFLVEKFLGISRSTRDLKKKEEFGGFKHLEKIGRRIRDGDFQYVS